MADNYCNCCGDGTPEYIIELNQQGAPGKRGEKGEQGYSPIVDFIVDDNEIKFTSTNENNVTSTPNLYDYVLKRDGSNALNPIKLNQIYIKNNSIYTQSSSIDFGDSSSNNQHIANIYYKNIRLKGNSPYLENNRGTLTIRGQDGLYLGAISGGISLGNTIHITDNIPYIGTQDPNNKIATIGDIPEVSNSKITISQGDVVKGSFTLNQSGDTTIELDTGITNPLKITKDNKTLEIGYDENDRVYISNKTIEPGGGTSTNIALLTPNVYNDPIRLQQINNIPGLEGEYYVKLNYDNNTLKLNDNKQLYADFTGVNNSISELTTLANNTEASLNELKTDYQANKTVVAEELTNLGNQLNTKVSKTEVAKLADTKNDNIFDIGKFTVVGSLTITDDGVASGFSASDYVYSDISVNSNNVKLKFSFNYKYSENQQIWFRFIGTSTANNLTNLEFGKFGGTGNMYIRATINGTNYTYIYASNVFSKNWTDGDLIECEYNLSLSKFTGLISNATKSDSININYTYSINELSFNKINIGGLGVASSIDLKHFSITVDGEEVFNGLMDSTKPIYDKITTTNTTLSTFQTDTDNNFSAVNSALNEKANISDLANYVPLATYNALLARVEALEAEINGGNA